MPFPEAERVYYHKNPLDKVICQLRFPPILRIDTEIPDHFQDAIRRRYPNYSGSSEWNVNVPQNISGPIPPEILSQLVKSTGNKNHEFTTENVLWKVNLTSTFIALTALEYRRWEEFKDMLSVPLRAVLDVYEPSYFSRVGLRYIDIIKRSNLGLEDEEWGTLLQPYITGIMGTEDVGPEVQSFENSFEIALEDRSSKVKIITKFVETTDTRERCFLIDSDFFNSEKTFIGKEMDKLDFFNKRGTRLIQWCITDKLHHAMEPEKI